MNFILHRLAVFVLVLAFVPGARAFLGFGDDEDVVWESGEQYVKLVQQDKLDDGITPPNDHPVRLGAEEIRNALRTVRYWEKGGILGGLFSKKEENDLFSSGLASNLGLRLSEALAKAKPDQDVVFAFAYIKPIAIGIKDRAYIAGRAFYQGGKLNIILGDYDRAPDRAKEVTGKAFSVEEVTYYFNTGGRSRSTRQSFSVITGNGVDLYDAGGKTRRDWLVIDVKTAAAAYRDESAPQQSPADTAALQAEAARMAEERWRMREEMARMRKEMKEMSGAEGEGRSIEERLATLNALYEKKLINKEEYEAKRKEILGDI